MCITKACLTCAVRLVPAHAQAKYPHTRVWHLGGCHSLAYRCVLLNERIENERWCAETETYLCNDVNICDMKVIQGRTRASEIKSGFFLIPCVQDIMAVIKKISKGIANIIIIAQSIWLLIQHLH